MKARRAVSPLVVRKYGERLMNATGPASKLIEAGLLPKDFDFPKVDIAGAGFTSKRWEDGTVTYHLSPRRINGSGEPRYGDDWWLSVTDRSKPYPDDFIAIHRAELAECR